jgi:hypothetical protein
MNAKKPWIVPLHSSGESDASSEMNLCSEMRAAIRMLLGHGSDLDLYVLPVASNIHQAPLWSWVLPVGAPRN